MRLAGKGQTSPHGGPPGDLYLAIQIAPHARFRLEQKDIYLETPITPWEAALGTAFAVPTLSGDLHLKIPAGARSGQKLRLPKRGMPSADGAGDFLVQLQVVVPPNLSDTERELYRQLSELSAFDPRPDFPKEEAASEA